MTDVTFNIFGYFKIQSRMFLVIFLFCKNNQTVRVSVQTQESGYERIVTLNSQIP